LFSSFFQKKKILERGFEMSDNYYVVYWFDGTNIIIHGTDIKDAFVRAGYGVGAEKAMDYYEECCVTQGGGVVALDRVTQLYMFVADPPEPFEVGDFMPPHWGIQPYKTKKGESNS